VKHPFDWSAAAERASRMDVYTITCALRDIQRTLDNADAMDRATGGDYGGRLRDEASVLHAELRTRRGGR
jgi:hypothetical protein